MGNERAFISFVGLGKKVNGEYDYIETTYEWLSNAYRTKYVQVAELCLLDKKFDKIILLTTERSYETHFEKVKKEILGLGYIESQVFNISLGNQKEFDKLLTHESWFAKFCDVVSFNSLISIDITHGFRILPILLQTTLSFLKFVKDIEIEHLLYGAFEVQEDRKPILDLVDFTSILDWADGVSDFKRNLNITKLNSMVKRGDNFKMLDLNERDIKELEKINLMIKSANMTELPNVIADVLEKLKQKEINSLSNLLVSMIIEKLQSIAFKDNLQYDLNFFRIEFELINLLIEHELIMQAFTVMRETIASLGLVNYEKKINLKSKEGRSKRRLYCEVFLRMIEYDEAKWHFEDETIKNKLYDTIYVRIKHANLLQKLQTISKKITNIRNAMDHAYTSKLFKSIWHKENDAVNIKNEIKDLFKEFKEVLEAILKISLN